MLLSRDLLQIQAVETCNECSYASYAATRRPVTVLANVNRLWGGTSIANYTPPMNASDNMK